MARLPDRDKLIDEDVQRKADRYRVEGLLAADAGGRQGPAPERFVAIYYAAMRAWGHWDLLERPRRAARRIVR